MLASEPDIINSNTNDSASLKKVSFKESPVDTDGLNTIIKEINNNTNLEEIDFHYQKCNKTGFKKVFEAVSQSQSIKRVSIYTLVAEKSYKGGHSHYSYKEHLLATMEFSATTREIKINSVQSKEVTNPLAEALRKNNIFSSIVFLNHDYTTKEITRALVYNSLAYNSPLAALSFENNSSSVADLIRHAKSLKRLSLDYCKWTTKMTLALKNNSSIEDLSLTNITMDQSQGTELYSVIFNNSRLKRVVLPSSNYSFPALLSNLARNNSLQYLKINPYDFIAHGFNDYIVSILVTLTLNNLEELVLPYNDMSEQNRALMEALLLKNRSNSIYAPLNIDKEYTHQKILLAFRNNPKIHLNNLVSAINNLQQQFPQFIDSDEIDTSNCSTASELHRFYMGIYNLQPITEADYKIAWQCLSLQFNHKLLQACAHIALAQLVFSCAQVDTASPQNRISCSQFILAHLPGRRLELPSFNAMAVSAIYTLLNNGEKDRGAKFLSELNNVVVVSWYQLLPILIKVSGSYYERWLLRDIFALQYYHPAVTNFLWQSPAFLTNLRDIYPSTQNFIVLEDFLSPHPEHWIKRTITTVESLKKFHYGPESHDMVINLPNILVNGNLFFSKVESVINSLPTIIDSAIKEDNAITPAHKTDYEHGFFKRSTSLQLNDEDNNKSSLLSPES